LSSLTAFVQENGLESTAKPRLDGRHCILPAPSFTEHRR
jgi:hypothetical protein